MSKLQEQINKYNSQLNLLNMNKFLNRKKIKTLKKVIQALEEGLRKDVLTPSVTGLDESQGAVDKNNYPTYAGQIKAINEMYNNRTDYAGEFLRSVIDTRTAFIIGEGITIKCNNKATVKWINDFLNVNKLRGSKIIDHVTITEMEGKIPLILFPEKSSNPDKKGDIKVRSYSYYRAPYEVFTKENNDEEYEKITFQKNQQEAKIDDVKSDRFVYIKTGGSPDRLNNTPPRIANILTDIENASRCKYDMRKNNHLFGRVTPYFETETASEAKSLFEKIQAVMWKVGKAFAGTAKFSLVEPSGNAINALKEELIIYMKHISLNTGIPLQWLAYPELLSNRATAENMAETINFATIKERTLWEEGLKELIQKAMIIAFEKGWISSAAYKPNDFEIEIPQVSIALLERLMNIWVPLAESGYISKITTMGMIPGIDPTKEKEFIETEKNENMERMQNSLLGKNAIGKAIENNNKKDENMNEEENNVEEEKEGNK